MQRLLLVEDEKNFAMVLRDYLGMNGFNVSLCENGEQGMQTFREGRFDLCILDVMMPKKDGFSLSREIKALRPDTPIVFLTARSQREDVVKGYLLGADDYIIKPFDSEVLLLKIRAILARQQKAVSFDQFMHEIGSYHFNARLRTLVRAGAPTLKLSPKEAELLQLLCEHRNDVLPRTKALKQIWKDDNYFTGRSMDVYIVKLRKYLSGDPGVNIHNLHGNGYCLRVTDQKAD